MPWTNQNGGGSGGGGWKSGGGGPWGQGPSGGGQPPDLEDFLKRGQDRLKQVMPGGSGLPGWLMLLLAALGTAIVCFYAFTFSVQPDELGVVLRFGQFVRQEPPGLHFRLPFPVEEVRLPKVTRKNTIEIGSARGLSSTSSGGRSVSASTQSESQMLTGDENVVDVPFVVYWRIQDAEKYLFQIKDPDQTVRDVAESAMREIVGQRKFQDILTAELGAVRVAVQKLMQGVLDNYNSGIIIDEISLQRVFPPGPVTDAFRDVQAAKIDLETATNDAEAYRNKVVPEAKGESDRMLAQAEGYKNQVVAEATGAASRFLNVYEQYKKAPEVTRRRLFLETMERVYSGADKIILDSKGGPGVVPYLPLGDQRRPAAATPARPATGGN